MHIKDLLANHTPATRCVLLQTAHLKLGAKHGIVGNADAQEDGNGDGASRGLGRVQHRLVVGAQLVHLQGRGQVRTVGGEEVCLRHRVREP